MAPSYRQQSRSTALPPWAVIIQRHSRSLLFVLLALVSMYAVFWYFSPITGMATAVAAAGDAPLAAPIVKDVPNRTVSQRFPQSPAPINVALIAGHKESDVGAVCEDGLTEASVNERIANLVVDKVQAAGYSITIFNEFDPRLSGYSGTAVISIHADSCDAINNLASGFKIASSSITDSTALESCVEQAYARGTRLPYHANTITPHMTNYHAFREIGLGTPAIILETGFMNLDRDLLTTNADVVATAISNGILCYLEEVS